MCPKTLGNTGLSGIFQYDSQAFTKFCKYALKQEVIDMFILKRKIKNVCVFALSAILVITFFSGCSQKADM